jgi:AraC-like DNA-binding protein
VSAGRGSLAKVGYREHAPPPHLRELVECVWTAEGDTGTVRILPDGCMDVMRIRGRLLVAGPDTGPYLAERGPEPSAGVRFLPGVLPRLLGVPAAELINTRVALQDLNVGAAQRDTSLIDLAFALAARNPAPETAPWSLAQLARVTQRLGAGVAVADVADDIGWSNRTLQRHCAAVFGYGPATLRRILRFRRALGLLDRGLSTAAAAARAGYADQPHMHREVKALAGVPLAQLASGANRSTQFPSGSATVA